MHNFSAGSPPGALARRFEETIGRHGLIVPGDAVLAAVSGGPDSVALLHLLAERASVWNLRLGIAHLDHGLREESAREVEFVRQIAASLSLPLHSERLDVRDLQRRLRCSLEAAGRAARYRFLQETADRCAFDKVALAHHADDNVETFLLNLLRGSGRLGLSGMPPIREGRFVRPLICATRADILDYLRRRHLSALSDPTNADDGFLRNRIRNQLLPLLERDYQPRVRAVLHRSMEILREEDAWIEGEVQSCLDQAVAARQPGRLALRARALQEMPPALQRRTVRAALRFVQTDLQRIAFVHVEAVLDLVQKPGDGGPLRLPGGLRVRRRAEVITISSGDPAPASSDYSYRMESCGVLTVVETGDSIALTAIEPGATVNPSGAGPLTAYLDAAAVEFPVTVRNVRPGDRFSPLGLDGTQKVKKFFIAAKVPRDQRRRCPLLLSKGRILWVAGHRIDHRARLGPRTRQVLKAEWILANPLGSD